MADKVTTQGMTRLNTFFRGSETQFGIFYPKDHLVAIFPGLDEAMVAERTLRNGGFAEDDVLAVSGEEVVLHAQEHVREEGVAELVMTEVMSALSRLIGTEAIYADQDLAMAKQGSAFLAVRAPTEQSKLDAWKLIEHLSPLVARHYFSGGIDVLRGTGADHARAA